MSEYILVCTNDCGIEVINDPGAAGNKCPDCGKGALVAEGYHDD